MSKIIFASLIWTFAGLLPGKKTTQKQAHFKMAFANLENELKLLRKNYVTFRVR